MRRSSPRPPVHKVLRAAQAVRALCAGLPLTRVEFGDGVLEWHPASGHPARGSVTIFADETVADTRPENSE